MLYSILDDENNYYLKLHAECALHTNLNAFMSEDEERVKGISRYWQGMYCETVKADVFDELYKYNYSEKNLCVDFEMITDVFDNNLFKFMEFIKIKFCGRNKNVYLINLGEKIYEKINSIVQGKNVQMYNGKTSITIGAGRDEISYSGLTKNWNHIFFERLEVVIKECTDSMNGAKEHTSVPIYLTKYINIKKMFEKYTVFFRLCIYCLGLKLIENELLKKTYRENENISLFFHTLNGGVIATQLSQLFNLNMVYLDHLGPIESVHRKHFEKSIADSRNYIVVSDVICLGGEVGRAKTIIEYCGGKVSGEVCIVDIETIKDRKNKNRVSLYAVSNRNNLLNYTIKTDFCHKCDRGDGCGE